MKKHLAPLLIATLGSSLPSAGIGAEEPTDGLTLVQGSIGLMTIKDQNGEWRDFSDQGVDIDFANLGVIGAEGEYTFSRGWVHWGLNPGGSIGWQSEDTKFSGSSTSDSGLQAEVELDNSFFLAELHLGGFVRGRLSQRITTYLAAGPTIVYAEHSNEGEEVTPDTAPEGADNFDNEDAAALDLGYYARAGIDFEVRPGESMGFGVRYHSAKLDFNDTIGKIDVDGTQILFTYSINY